MSSMIESMPMSKEETNIVTVGEKVERFYLAFREAENQLPALLEALFYVETHLPVAEESYDVVAEIVTDCQKKVSQILRGNYVENVRQIIAIQRKRLASKVALDNDLNSQSHGQRHLNYLLELLGSWSNIVAEISHWGISRTILRMTIAPLHARVIEMAYECFQKFKEDKNLDTWHNRVIESSLSSDHTGNGSSFNIATLDLLLSQLSAMRDIVQQYYKFIYRALCTAYDYENDVINDITAAAVPTTTNAISDDTNSTKTNDRIQTPPHRGSQMDLLCTAEERNRWRELDAVYISLEYGYLSRSIGEALCESSLLEIESYNGISTDNDDKTGQSSGSSSNNSNDGHSMAALAPQAVEDVFFLLQRVSERALATGSEASVFAVGNKIVELLDQSDDMVMDMSTAGNINGGREATLFGLLRRKQTFRGCHRRHAIHVSLSTHQQRLKHQKERESHHNTATTTTTITASTNEMSSVASGYSISTWLRTLEEIAAPLPTQGTTDPNDHRLVGGHSDVRKGNRETDSSSGSGTGVGTLADLLSALENDATGDGDLDRLCDERTPLSPADAAIQLTALALAPTAIIALVSIYQRAESDLEELELAIENSNNQANNTSGIGEGGSSGLRPAPASRNRKTISLICQELIRCSHLYTQSLQMEAKAFAMMILRGDTDSHYRTSSNRDLYTALQVSLCTRSYDIDGDTMERRQGDCPLVHVVRLLLGPSLALTEAGIAFLSSTKATTSSISNKKPATSNAANHGPSVGVDDSGSSSWIDIMAPTTTTSTNTLHTLGILIARGMSTPARNEVLVQLANLLTEAILDTIAPSTAPNPCPSDSSNGGSSGGSSGGLLRVSEWGALLLHGEIMAITKLFHEATDNHHTGTPDINPSFSSASMDQQGSVGTNTMSHDTRSLTSLSPRVRIRNAFSSLTWAMKLLTLDQPADIRRYIIPHHLQPPLTEERIRVLLGRRTEFSKDAVLRVKINIQ